MNEKDISDNHKPELNGSDNTDLSLIALAGSNKNKHLTDPGAEQIVKGKFPDLVIAPEGLPNEAPPPAPLPPNEAIKQKLPNGNDKYIFIDGSSLVRESDKDGKPGRVVETTDAHGNHKNFRYEKDGTLAVQKGNGEWKTYPNAKVDESGNFFSQNGDQVHKEYIDGRTVDLNLKDNSVKTIYEGHPIDGKKNICVLEGRRQGEHWYETASQNGNKVSETITFVKPSTRVIDTVTDKEQIANVRSLKTYFDLDTGKPIIQKIEFASMNKGLPSSLIKLPNNNKLEFVARSMDITLDKDGKPADTTYHLNESVLLKDSDNRSTQVNAIKATISKDSEGKETLTLIDKNGQDIVVFQFDKTNEKAVADINEVKEKFPRLAELIKELRSIKYAEREKAAAEIEKLGRNTFPVLRDLAASGDNLDIRRAAQSIMGKQYNKPLPESFRTTMREFNQNLFYARRGLSSEHTSFAKLIDQADKQIKGGLDNPELEYRFASLFNQIEGFAPDQPPPPPLGETMEQVGADLLDIQEAKNRLSTRQVLEDYKLVDMAKNLSAYTRVAYAESLINIGGQNNRQQAIGLLTHVIEKNPAMVERDDFISAVRACAALEDKAFTKACEKAGILGRIEERLEPPA